MLPSRDFPDFGETTKNEYEVWYKLDNIRFVQKICITNT